MGNSVREPSRGLLEDCCAAILADGSGLAVLLRSATQLSDYGAVLSLRHDYLDNGG